MNITEIIDSLKDLAKADTLEGADIYDHPCTVAVRALKGCTTDINILRRHADSKGKSKKVQVLIKTPYDPTY